MDELRLGIHRVEKNEDHLLQGGGKIIEKCEKALVVSSSSDDLCWTEEAESFRCGSFRPMPS